MPPRKPRAKNSFERSKSSIRRSITSGATCTCKSYPPLSDSQAASDTGIADALAPLPEPAGDVELILLNSPFQLVEPLRSARMKFNQEVSLNIQPQKYITRLLILWRLGLPFKSRFGSFRHPLAGSHP